MATAHLEINHNDITNIVLMPGDPLRAKYIADNFLENAILINTVRNNLGYTGYYKGKKITVIASGMGIPSMGIYSYALFNYYNVVYIIRIGTCGALKSDVKVKDVILVNSVYSESSFAKIYNNSDNKEFKSNEELNNIIEETARNNNINIKKCSVLTTDVFEPYAKDNILNKLIPSYLMASEMESFALFFMADYLNKKATTILTVSDSKFESTELTALERQTSLNNMIILALESTIMLK